MLYGMKRHLFGIVSSFISEYNIIIILEDTLNFFFASFKFANTLKI